MRSSLQAHDPHVQLMLEENAAEKRKVKMLVEEMHIGGLMEDGEEALNVFGLGCSSNKTLRYFINGLPKILVLFYFFKHKFQVVLGEVIRCIYLCQQKYNVFFGLLGKNVNLGLLLDLYLYLYFDN